MQEKYHKLVRDRIPEIILQDGCTSRIETLDEHEFELALREKLLEEAHEVASAPPYELLNELADLYEVLDTLLQQHALTPQMLQARQAERFQARGGFSQRIRLLEVLR